MTDARRDILAKLSARSADVAPPLPPAWFATRASGVQLGWHDFAEALIESHGEFHGPIPMPRLHDFLEQCIGSDFATTADAASWLDRDFQSLSREQLDGIDWMVATGSHAVARNGAVAVTAVEAPARVELLLSESLVILVREDRLLQDLDQLYDLCTATPRSYLTLICGPSKTADIEQTLVKGAHGPRRLWVVCVSD